MLDEALLRLRLVVLIAKGVRHGVFTDALIIDVCAPPITQKLKISVFPMKLLTHELLLLGKIVIDAFLDNCLYLIRHQLCSWAADGLVQVMIGASLSPLLGFDILLTIPADSIDVYLVIHTLEDFLITVTLDKVHVDDSLSIIYANHFSGTLVNFLQKLIL